LKLFLDSSYLIYLRYALRDDVADFVTALLKKAVENNISLLVNMIVLDETIWILMKKYEVQLGEILELTDRLTPLLEIVPLDYSDYDVMKRTMIDHGLNPLDALHVASMNKTRTEHIASEDKEFDKISSIKRVWLDTPHKTI